MSNENQHPKKAGHYFGTEIDEKWWKRYSKNKMLARGKGEYWFDSKYFYFLRLLTKEPISIPINSITAFKLGKWHAGQWAAGNQILKIIWSKNNLTLSSGFLVSNDETETNKLISTLMNLK